jgi:hypothetical protein
MCNQRRPISGRRFALTGCVPRGHDHRMIEADPGMGKNVLDRPWGGSAPDALRMTI